MSQAVAELPLWAAIGSGILVGVIAGAVNGIAISYFGLPDIVTSIATGSIAAGMAFLYSGGIAGAAGAAPGRFQCMLAAISGSAERIAGRPWSTAR